MQLRQLGGGLHLVVLDGPQFPRAQGDTHSIRLSVGGIWAGLPKLMLAGGKERNRGQRWQLLVIISQMAFQNWPFSDVLIARSFLLATPSCHPELRLGPHPGPHPAPRLLGGSDLLQ